MLTKENLEFRKLAVQNSFENKYVEKDQVGMACNVSHHTGVGEGYAAAVEDLWPVVEALIKVSKYNFCGDEPFPSLVALDDLERKCNGN